MPTLLHLREKAIVYAMRCLLETLKLLFKNRAASLCTFRATLCIFYLHKTFQKRNEKQNALTARLYGSLTNLYAFVCLFCKLLINLS